MENYLLTVKEAAEMLRVTPRRVRWLLAESRLDGRLHGNVWLVSRESVERFRPQPVGWKKGRSRKKVENNPPNVL